MNETLIDQIDVGVIATEAASATKVKSVVQSLGFHASEFASVEEFFRAKGLVSPSCIVLCAGDNAELARTFQQQILEQGVYCLSIIVVTDIQLREAVKLMEQGAMTVLTGAFDQNELADYLKSAGELDRERRETRLRVKELESCRQSLSDRQLKILNMVEQGHSNRQIANWFDLSQRTIELERARLMSAFQSASVAQLVSKWTELRVLTKTWHRTDTAHVNTAEQTLHA